MKYSEFTKFLYFLDEGEELKDYCECGNHVEGEDIMCEECLEVEENKLLKKK